MNELILVLILLINGPDGRIQLYGPITDGVDGPVMTWSSHNECTDFGDKVVYEDDTFDGFICTVKPMPRRSVLNPY